MTPTSSDAAQATPRTDGVVRPVPGSPGRREAFLPAPAVQAHAANLAWLPGGDLACTWFGGTMEGVSDINVWFSRLRDGVWTEPVQVSDDPERSEQNPVLFNAAPGELWLFHTAQRAGDQDTAEVRLRVSTDEGRTWGPARTVLPPDASGGVFVRQPVVVMPSGRWLLPVWRCPKPAHGAWVGDDDTSSVMVSDDRGRTWAEHPVPDSTGCVHMSIVPSGDGLLALFRRRQADFVHRSVSADGVTWSVPEPTELPNNNSSVQAAAVSGGRVALVFNASSREDATERRTSLYDDIGGESASGSAEGTAFWGAPRAPLSLAFTSDAGVTWSPRLDLATGDGYCITNNSRDGLNRELSYPSVVQAPDGGLRIAFTHHRQAIKYVELASLPPECP